MNEGTFTKAREVNRLLRGWYSESRRMLGYTPGEGGPYLGYLLGIDWYRNNLVTFTSKVNDLGIYDQLLGPHGWAVLQMLIIKKAERDRLDKKRKELKRAKARSFPARKTA